MISATDYLNKYFNPPSAYICLSLTTFAFAFPEKTSVYHLRIYFTELIDEDYEGKATTFHTSDMIQQPLKSI